MPESLLLVAEKRDKKLSATRLTTWPYSHILTVSTMKDRAVYKHQAGVLKALANESRLMLIDRLGEGECTVGDLTEMLGRDQSTVSKHLAMLRAHGIVEDRREGNNVYYTLCTPCVRNFFACAKQVIQERR